MKLLVTGSSGQIGSYVVDHAQAEGHETTGVDLEPGEGTDIVGDVRKASVCRDAVEGCHAIVHCAAQVSVQKSLDAPAEDASHNVIGTVNVLDAAAEAPDTRTVVNVSSAAVYGDPEALPIPEGHPARPLAPYGQSKLAAEGYARLYDRTRDIHVVNARPFNVYSPRQDASNPYSGVISAFAQRIQGGDPPIVHGDGMQTRDFIHAEDVAWSLLRLATRDERVPFGAVNLGTGSRTSILELARLMVDLAGLDVAPLREERPEGEIMHSAADTHRARGLGLEPEVPLKDGLEGILKPGAS